MLGHRLSRSVPVVLLAAIVVGWSVPSVAAVASPTKLILISWDGAADWVVDRLLAEGRLPNLASLAAQGVAAESSRTTYPSKTAAAHAAIWTGCWPETNGVTSNEVPLLPRGEHNLLERLSGFSSAALLAEPLYITAAKAGKRVVVLSATQSDPPEPHLAALAAAGVPVSRYRSFSGFEYPIAAARVLRASDFGPAQPGWGPAIGPGARQASLLVGEETFYFLAFDDPDDPTVGFDRILVRQGSRDPAHAGGEDVLLSREAVDGAPTGWSRPFAVRNGDRAGNTFFRLFELAPDGAAVTLYQRTAQAVRGAASPEDLDAYREAYLGFHDWPFTTYESGDFGLPLPLGGDGTAERRALELVAFDLQLVSRATRFAIERWQPDVLFHYTPMSDSAGHTWVGVLDPHAPAHDPLLAERLWPFYARVFELQDAWLGDILEIAPPETVVAVVSDHGMAGADRFVYVNPLLARAGLLAWHPDGTIDLGHTQALAPFPDFMVRLNTTDWKDGIVPPADRNAVLAQVEDALLEAVDPESGRHLFPRVFRPEEMPELGEGGPRAGELLFDLAAGYYPQQGFSPTVVGPARLPWGEGHHGFWPERRDMEAIFYAAGPGLVRGVRLSGLRQVDIAPTLARLLGIPAPPQAIGRVLAEALIVPRCLEEGSSRLGDAAAQNLP